MPVELLLLIVGALLGSLAGIMSGLLGVGGGIILVPAFIWLLEYQAFPSEHLVHYAVATSLATIVVTSAASARAHHARGNVAWQSVLRLSAGILLGAGVAGLLSVFIPSQLLARIFALFLIWGAWAMWRDKRREAGQQRSRAAPANLELAAAGGGIGFLSTLLGIGGGTMMVPYLHFRGLAMIRAVGSAASCGLVIALAGSAGFLFAGWSQPATGWSIGFIYLPLAVGVCLTSIWFAPLGAWLADKLPVKAVKRGFALLMLGGAVKLLVG